MTRYPRDMAGYGTDAPATNWPTGATISVRAGDLGADSHPPGHSSRPCEMDKETFVAEFGGVFEHCPWIAEEAYELEFGPAHDIAGVVHNALARVFRSASEVRRLGVLVAHPDLAGKLAAAKRLTAESTAEQASVGLDALTDDERIAFTQLNDAYTAKFDFPFIIAVRDNTKASIIAAFRTRVENDRNTEFALACRQVERIAEIRLQEKLSA